jgi:hypothetical protein
MSDASKSKAMTLLIVVLIAGGVMGWVAHQLATPTQQQASRGVDALMTRYTRELNLDAVQEDSVRSILVRRQREMRIIWQEMHPRYETVRTRAKSEIEAQLRPDQRELFEQLMAQEDQERNERLKDRGLTDTTQGQRQ